MCPMVVHASMKVLQRRREVTTLLVRGMAPGEIAEMLEVPCHTIYNDIRVIRSGSNEALMAHTRKEIAAQLFLNAQERAKYLWRLVDRTQKDSTKLQALKELRLNDERITWRLPAIADPREPVVEPWAIRIPWRGGAGTLYKAAAPLNDVNLDKGAPGGEERAD